MLAQPIFFLTKLQVSGGKLVMSFLDSFLYNCTNFADIVYKVALDTEQKKFWLS